jgi:outer membrane lipoprotein-sorting protein
MRWGLAAGAIAVASLTAAQEHRPKGGRFGKGAELPAVLKRAIAAAPKLTFSGSRIVEFKRGPHRSRHVENVIKQGPRIRIEFPGDSPYSGQIIVEDGEQRQHFFPDRNEIYVMPLRRDETLSRLVAFIGKLGPGTRFAEGEPEMVAGVRATPITALDTQGNRLAKFWVDQRTAMMLKRELYDPVGAIVGLLEYSSISFRPLIRKEDFQIRREGARIVTPTDVARRLMKEGGMAEVFLPAEGGLKLEFARLVGERERKILVLTYQSPSGPVSFYQFTGDLDPKRLRREAGHDFKTVSWTARGRTFVLVAEMPEDRLQAIARKVQGP